MHFNVTQHRLRVRLSEEKGNLTRLSQQAKRTQGSPSFYYPTEGCSGDNSLCCIHEISQGSVRGTLPLSVLPYYGANIRK